MPEIASALKTPPIEGGCLYIVPTPIGRMEDITLRALRTLREVDVIACEDTRVAGRLLTGLGINNRLLSLHGFNEAKRSVELIERLRNHESAAVISDAGTPGVSDPGERLIRRVLQEGLKVESLPGPCAAITALTGSGLPTGEFHFIGFLPQKSGQRHRVLERLKAYPATLILYESPHRILKLLGELETLFPSCPTVIARELTKKFESYYRGVPSELIQRSASVSLKGEMVVLVDNSPKKKRPTKSVDRDDSDPA